MRTNSSSESLCDLISPTIDLVCMDQETKPSLSWDENRSGWAIEMVGKYPVGYGGHSDVWKASLKRNGAETLVALKVHRCSGSDQARLRMCDCDDAYQRLQREVTCWKPLKHKNIAHFLGVHYQSNGAPAIILPWYKNGSADVYLRTHENINPMNIMREVACGVEYLHAKGIIHGDLKGANIMIDGAGHARLIDFGLARHIDSEDDTMSSITSSIRWCAPELICSPGHSTKASDVYAFASTILELLTGAVPYAKLPTTAVYWMALNSVTPRHHFDPLLYDISAPDLLWRFLERCWSQPSRRPIISDVKQSVGLFRM